MTWTTRLTQAADNRSWSIINQQTYISKCHHVNITFIGKRPLLKSTCIMYFRVNCRLSMKTGVNGWGDKVNGNRERTSNGWKECGKSGQVRGGTWVEDWRWRLGGTAGADCDILQLPLISRLELSTPALHSVCSFNLGFYIHTSFLSHHLFALLPCGSQGICCLSVSVCWL